MTTRTLIMAGGTGGHVFPALAVADVLHQQGVEVSWMGTAKGIEAKTVPAAGYPLTCISVQGLRGKGLIGWLLAPFRLLKAIFEALFALKKIRPDVVLGLGGFASGPGGIAAWLLRKPLIIHEQNAIPGLTNRLLAKIAKQVMTGFPQSFPSSVTAEWVGNPVRNSIESLATPEKRFADRTGPIRLLVLGGSLGARALNKTVPEALALLGPEQRPEVIHQCGKRHLEDCKQTYEEVGIKAEINAFIENMETVYGWADLVVCRAGALTIAELSAAGVGAILVPFPYAVDDHQTYNAAALVRVGAASLIQEETLTAELLADKLSQLFQQRETMLSMAIAARSQAKTGTAERVAAECMEFAHA